MNDALQAWEGGIVLVTHDGRLIQNVANNIWIMNHEDRRIDHWEGTFSEYRQKLIDEKYVFVLLLFCVCFKSENFNFSIGLQTTFLRMPITMVKIVFYVYLFF